MRRETFGADLPVIDQRCLLVCPIPFHQMDDGSVWVDPLWYRDLIAHADYFSDLVVASPRLPLAHPSGMSRVEAPAGASLTWVALPHPTSARAAVWQLPRTLVALVGAIRNCEIIHSGVAGWPYPLGLIANPLAVLLRKRLVIVIESSFWRVVDRENAGPKARIRHRLNESFARWSVRRASLSIFTSTAYRDSLASPTQSGEMLVAPAAWIAAEDILDEGAAATAWAAKPATPSFVFAGRLTVEKGVGVLLEALADLDRRGTELRVDVIGSGPLREVVERASAQLKHVTLELRQPVPYGPRFFRFLRGYHAIIVPAISDEQPRIVFDAYSQAVPVVASDTGGHRDCVRENETGRLVTAGDASALADTLDDLARHVERLPAMARGALSVARSYTHEGMHLTRARAIHRMLAGRLPGSSSRRPG